MHVNGTLGHFVGGEGSLSPDFYYWLLAGLAIAFVGEVRGRRHFSTPSASRASSACYVPPLRQRYGVLASEGLGNIDMQRTQQQTRSDRDLDAVETRALLHAQTWLKTKAKPTSVSFPDTGPVGVGLPSPGDGISYLAWKIRGHLFLDDRAWRHFYRTLALRYAEKYPDITAADWDACVTYVASTAFVEDTASPMFNFSLRSSVVFIGAVALNYMTSRWAARPRMLLLGLNRVVQLGWYCSTVPLTLALVSPVLHYRRPLQLQDKACVAEMLGEAYRGVD